MVMQNSYIWSSPFMLYCTTQHAKSRYENETQMMMNYFVQFPIELVLICWCSFSYKNCNKQSEKKLIILYDGEKGIHPICTSLITLYKEMDLRLPCSFWPRNKHWKKLIKFWFWTSKWTENSIYLQLPTSDSALIKIRSTWLLWNRTIFSPWDFFFVS